MINIQFLTVPLEKVTKHVKFSRKRGGGGGGWGVLIWDLCS